MSVPSAGTVAEVLAYHAGQKPDAPALVLADREPLTFGELGKFLDSVRAQLAAAKLGPGSRIGVAFPRGSDAALLSLGVCSAATLVPLNSSLPAVELAHELAPLRLHGLIVPEGELPPWVDADPHAGLFTAPAADATGVELRCVRPASRPPGNEFARSYAAIFRTSGTTGSSKRVPVTHENLIEMARKMERWLGLAPTDRAACIMPIHYNAGFKATLLAPLLIGCSVAFSEFGRPKELVEELATLRPTWLTAAPAWLEALVDTLRQSPNKPEHTLRFILSTASYLPARTGSALQGLLGVPVAEFYGLCEAGMMTGPLLGTERESGFVGRLPPGELVLKGEDGRDVPVGEPGEIVLRGPSVTPGYIGDDIDAAPVGLDGGWLATGDLGVLDGRGNLKVIARSKEIINRGGEKISPYDVERALLAHPAVRQAAAFAIPHGRLGESVSAAVVLDPEAATRSDDLLDFVQQRLAPFQRPRTVHILDELPTSPTGKISRSQLSERFANERASGPLPDSPLEMLIARIWCERLQRPEIGLDEDFFEIGGDSLLATEMLVEVETTLGQHVRPSDIGNRLTVRILAQALKRTAASTGEVGYLAKEGGGAPLFLCHGDFDGWGLYGFRLARLLKREGPIHLLHSLLDDRRGIVSLEAMVSAYMSYVETAAPTGPVRLAGYCHGGLAALELANRLEAAGRIVETVVLLDVMSLNARPLFRLAGTLVQAAAKVAPAGLSRRLKRRAMSFLWVLFMRVASRERAIASRMVRAVRIGRLGAWDDTLRAVYFRAMANHVPRRVRAEVISVVCADNARKAEYAAGPWSRIASPVLALVVPGSHTSCITDHAEQLAESLHDVVVARRPSSARQAACLATAELGGVT